MKLIPAVLILALSFPLAAFVGDVSGCSYNGVPLYGKVRIVEHFGDFKVREVQHFGDLKVEMVSFAPDRCGKWELVSIGEDFIVEFVSIGEDFTIEYVTIAPGVR